MPQSVDKKTSSLNTEGAIRFIQSKGKYLFRAYDFSHLTGRDPEGAATTAALARLSKSGRIVSLVKRPSTWLIVPPEHEHYGAPPVTWWLEDFLGLDEPDYYLALLSAARYWGSAHYAQQSVQVMVAQQRRPLEVGRLRIAFTYKTAISQTPTVTITDSIAPYRVSTREATLLDLIRHSKEIGGLEVITRVTKDLAAKLSVRGMSQALDALDQTTVAQRMGFVLEVMDCKLARPVKKWLEGRRIRRAWLDSGEVSFEKPLLFNAQWGVDYTQRQLDLIRELA